MKYGRKNLILVNGNGYVIGNRRRYKRLERAVHNAIDFSIKKNSVVQVWDEDAGKELALIESGPRGIEIKVARRNTFYQYWEGKG